MYQTYRAYFKDGNQTFWRAYLAKDQSAAEWIARDKFLKPNPSWVLVKVEVSKQ